MTLFEAAWLLVAAVGSAQTPSPSPIPSPSGLRPTSAPETSGVASAGPGDHRASTLATRLSSPDAETRRHAVGDFGHAQLPPATLDELLPLAAGLVRDTDARVRIALAEAFGHLRTRSEQVLPTIELLLDDPEPSVRAEAVRAVASLGILTPSLLSRLGGFIERDAPDVAREAAKALGRLGGAASSDGVELMARALRSPDPAVREAAAHALGDAHHSPVAAAALERALSDQEPSVRLEALHAVSRLSQSDAHAVPLLSKALTDADLGVRTTAARALARFGAAALPALLQAVRDDHWLVRWAAVNGLESLGHAAAEAIPTLEKAAREDPRKEIRDAAARALTAIRGLTYLRHPDRAPLQRSETT